MLRNTEDNINHVFKLKGVGVRPLPCETMDLKCIVKKQFTKNLKVCVGRWRLVRGECFDERCMFLAQVPNHTNQKMFFAVESDLDFVTGPEYLTVLPGQTGVYPLTVCPKQRGEFDGVVSFVAREDPVKCVCFRSQAVYWSIVHVHEAAFCSQYFLELLLFCQYMCTSTSRSKRKSKDIKSGSASL